MAWGILAMVCMFLAPAAVEGGNYILAIVLIALLGIGAFQSEKTQRRRR
jgi:hypothetical protein